MEQSLAHVTALKAGVHVGVGLRARAQSGADFDAEEPPACVKGHVYNMKKEVNRKCGVCKRVNRECTCGLPVCGLSSGRQGWGHHA